MFFTISFDSHASFFMEAGFPIACPNGLIVENLAEKSDNSSLPHYGHRCEIFFVHFDTNWLDSVPQFICSCYCLSLAAVFQAYETGGL